MEDDIRRFWVGGCGLDSSGSGIVGFTPLAALPPLPPGNEPPEPIL
jgi:hypothetical protein